MFNFPVPVDGEDVIDLPLETETTVETVCLLGKRKPDAKVKIGIDMDDYYRIRENAESKYTFAKPNNTLKQSKTEAVDALEDNVSAALSFYIIGKFDIRRTLDKKSPHKSGHRKQTID